MIIKNLLMDLKKRVNNRSYKIYHQTVIDFDSQKEADYYCELKLKLKANEIKGFVYNQHLY